MTWAYTCAEKRLGKTNISFPQVGIPSKFETLRAGDFFMYKGKLHFKTDLKTSVEIPNGSDHTSGSVEFMVGQIVHVVNVEITVK